MVEDNHLVDDEQEENIEFPKPKNRIGSGVRAKKSFNENLEHNLSDINSKSRRTKNILARAFYEPFDVDTKETDLKWQFCTMCY